MKNNQNPRLHLLLCLDFISLAPATFQRLMDRILHGMDEFAAAYLDDIIIFSNSWKEHLEHLQRVLESLRGAGLTVKIRKCQIRMRECTYLGHIVENGVVHPEEKHKVIQGFPVPRRMSECF